MPCIFYKKRFQKTSTSTRGHYKMPYKQDQKKWVKNNLIIKIEIVIRTYT